MPRKPQVEVGQLHPVVVRLPAPQSGRIRGPAQKPRLLDRLEEHLAHQVIAGLVRVQVLPEELGPRNPVTGGRRKCLVYRHVVGTRFARDGADDRVELAGGPEPQGIEVPGIREQPAGRGAIAARERLPGCAEHALGRRQRRGRD